MSKGGQNTTTSTQSINPEIMGLITGNVNRASGIADNPFQAYNGNPYAGTGKQGTPGTDGYWSGGGITGYDDNGNPQYSSPSYTAGTPGTPGSPDATFDPNNFVAPLTANQNAAISAAPGLLTSGQGALNAGMNGAAGLLNYRPDSILPATANSNTVNRSSVSNVSSPTGASGMAAYQNPFENQVVQNSLNDIELQRQRAIGGNQDAAIAAGAFGGSRQGVADSLTNEAALRQAADTSASLRSQGFTTAAGLGQQDAGRNLQAQSANQGVDLSVAGQNANNQQQAGQFNAGAFNQAQAQNQQAGLAGAGIRQSAAGLLGNLSSQQQQQYQTGINGLLATGSLQQQTQQGGLDAAYNEFLRQIGYPMQGQQLINQSLGLLPSAGTTTTTAPKPDNTGGILQGVGSIAAAAATFF